MALVPLLRKRTLLVTDSSEQLVPCIASASQTEGCRNASGERSHCGSLGHLQVCTQ